MTWLDPDVTEGDFPYSERVIVVFLAATLLAVAALSGVAWGWWAGIGRRRWQAMTEKDARAWDAAIEQAAMRRRQQLIASEAGSHSTSREHASASLSTHKSAGTLGTFESFAASDRHLLAAPPPGGFSPPQLGSSPPVSAANSRPGTAASFRPFSGSSFRDSAGSEIGLLTEPLVAPRSRPPGPAGPRRLQPSQLAESDLEQGLSRSLSWRHRRAQQTTAPRLFPADEVLDDEAIAPHAALISSTSRARASVSLTRQVSSTSRGRASVSLARQASSKSYNGRAAGRHGAKASISSIRGGQNVSRDHRAMPDLHPASQAVGARRALQQRQANDSAVTRASVGPPLSAVRSAPQSWRASEVPDPMPSSVQGQRRGSGFFARLGDFVSGGDSSSSGSHDKPASLALQPILPPSPRSQRALPPPETPSTFDFPNSLAYPPLQPSTLASQRSPMHSAQAGFYTPQAPRGSVPTTPRSALPTTPRSALPTAPFSLPAPDSAAHPASQRNARPETLVRYEPQDSSPGLL
ncbi:hypothetical protein FA09DRAFT_345649 [Tilletiopsis washingtonensis]|jgi:hypothetical protein|uniref:Uncharacterized protein n=1 Tax=Tilletiopsis washingtonensis TaxID=58919 RepID=A0A316ZDR3_9BASI|nr:hypothetical protein FA09DRAFT_345649 [Tilletiopsis washingtonensis]PWN99174.1 hypothetical protein FA09DRAFT_345649 [Tilletiopsis washingtonensis]